MLAYLLSFVLIVSAQEKSAPAKPPSYHVPYYDANFPLRETDSDISNWMLNGMAVVTPSGISVAGETSGQRGSMWNHIPMSAESFEMELDIDVRGPPEPKTADGFGVWFVEENDIGSFLRQPSPEIWTMYGYRPRFKGFGAFFATANRENKPTPSVSGAINDGTVTWDVLSSTPSSDGIYFNFRNESPTKGILKFHVMFTRDFIRGFVRWSSDNEWKPAFTLNTQGKMIKSGYLGVTASNRRSPLNATDTTSATGDRVVISRFRVTSSDAAWVSSSQVAGQALLASALEGNLDPQAHMRILSESMMKHVLPKQEHMLNEMSKLFQSHRLMSERIDILFSYLSNNEKLQQALDRLDTLKNVVFRSSRDHLQQMEALKDKLGNDQNVEILKQQSANIESTVKHHTQLAAYLTVGLGVVFVGFGVTIWKRMRDMEKKHIL